MTRKEAILQTATKLFSEKGFADASMAELSKMTGVAGGTIFYHFKNKEELLLSILASVKTGIIEEFEQYFSGKTFQNGMEMMEGVIAFHLYLAGFQEDWFLLLHRHYPYQLARVNNTCREHLEAVYNCFVEIYEKALHRGRHDGSIGDVPARKTALILFSLVDGIIRFKSFDLYDAGSLYNEVLNSCRRMLKNHGPP